jgi:hypothetical protein
MHLGSAWIGKADVDAALNQRPHQTFRTIHRSAPARRLGLASSEINHSLRVSSKV